MDALNRWSVHLVDLQTLFSEWERRFRQGGPWTRKFREINSACMFTLCLENGTDKRYLIGFQEAGPDAIPVRIERLFDSDFGEVEDVDFVLVDDPKDSGVTELEHHRCQMTSYINQPSTSEVDWVKALERKKLKAAPDNDLRLVIHIEQEGRFNDEFLSAYLQYRSPKCPYSQVFVFGQIGNQPRRWFCKLVYPEPITLPEFDEETAKKLVLDRQRWATLKPE